MIKKITETQDRYKVVLDSGESTVVNEVIKGYFGDNLIIQGVDYYYLHNVKTEDTTEIKDGPRHKRQYFTLAGRKGWYYAEDFISQYKTKLILEYLLSFKSNNVNELLSCLIKELLEKDQEFVIETIVEMIEYGEYQLADVTLFGKAFELGRIL